MNNSQKWILYIFLTMTLFIMLLHYLCAGSNLVNYIKFATVTALFAFTLGFKKKYREQVFLNMAVFFIVVADLFLVFGATVTKLNDTVAVVGAIAFLLAYLFLVLASSKGFRFRARELLAALLILSLFTLNYIMLLPYVTGFMFYGGTLFGLVLCYTTWSCICTLFRNHYKIRVACRIALAGCLIFISDMGVAQSYFNPAFQGQFNLGLAALVWGTYIPAWALIATVIAEDDLFVPNYRFIY